jgi:aryl-alcohol dehydrogenase-like predicted oxidoreductase
MTVPALGFGTAPILGRMARKPSVNALELAYARGVRHFDTARSYGWGEAEGVLGAFLARYPRESYTLVSKCGIIPARRSRALSIAKAAARQLVRLIPASQSVVRRAASSAQIQPAATYDVKLLKDSFQTTLRELRVDYLDVLLLHNYDPYKDGLDEVMRWFEELRGAGHIRSYGVSIEGPLREGIAYLVERGLASSCVIQAPLSDAVLSLPAEWRDLRFLVHSPFRFLSQRPELDLSTLLVKLGQDVRCEALICSMFTPAHIEANARARQLADTRAQ